jgi:phenylacetic acid degradation operon negative regulatory protein
MPKPNSISTGLLLAFCELAGDTADYLDAFLLSAGSVSQLKSNLRLKDRQYHSALQGLERNGYIERLDKNQFLISPKAKKKIKRLRDQEWNRQNWSGDWMIISFDIPEPQKSKRNIFRSSIKRMGFIGLQNSVFICPFADLDEICLLRTSLKIEKYVTMFQAKICQTEDDSKLRKRFGL